MTRTRTMLSVFALFGCLSLGVSGCASNSADAGAKDGKKDAPEAKQDGAPAGAEGKPVEGEQKVATAEGDAGAGGEPYKLQIEPSEGKVGEQGTVAIRVVPNTDWHMNMEYPTKLTVEPPAGVTVEKPKLGKDDAVKLDDHGCEFAVAFTPSEAGDKTFTGEFKFAVCQDTACVPKTEKLEFQVAVK